jgi:hypothetical protein
LKKATAVRILECFSPQIEKGHTAMTKAKVHGSTDQLQFRVEGIPTTVEELLGWLDFVQEEYLSLAHGLGAMVMTGLVESEVRLLAGKRHSRGTDIDRNGTQKGYVMLDGQKVRVRHTRLKPKEGGDVVPETYRRFQDDTPRTRSVFRHLLAGVSTRNYAKAVTEVADGYGISKSVVSREMVEATAEEIKRLVERPLGGFELRVLLVDGVSAAGGWGQSSSLPWASTPPDASRSWVSGRARRRTRS